MIGTTLAHFHITAKLGEGGMGEVWQAEDTRLGRQVAVKVLPQAFVADPERLARFEREARVLASLNHSHIAGIYEIGEHEGRHFLSMELAAGHTLADRLGQGALPAEVALPIALQIASALETAHEQGIVHRDLKPANVMVSEAGDVKLLDFGLAKAFAPELSPRSEALTRSPTLTAQMTQAGVLLGTAAYMSPEQAAGLPTDRRCDIWAFGVVLFEMLTGERLFAGQTVSHTLADVLRAQIDLDRLPATLPDAVRRLLGRCLDREPQRRLRDIGEARVVLEDVIAGRLPDATPSTAAAGGARRWRAWWPAIAGLCLFAGALGLLLLRPAAPAARPARRVIVEIPQALSLQASDGVALALSPDGGRLVTPGGSNAMMFQRTLDDFEWRPVAGSTGTFLPFFSPDGKWLGHTTYSRLSKTSMGGTLVPLGPMNGWPTGTTWSSDGHVYFTASGRLSRLPDGGGEPEVVASPAAGERFSRPTALPGGTAIVMDVTAGPRDPPRIVAYDLRAGRLEELGLQGTSPTWSPSGHLLWAQDGDPLVVAFDADDLETRGEPVRLDEPILVANDILHAAIAADGTLAYLPVIPGGYARVRILDREGRATDLPGDAGGFVNVEDPRFSPDGRRLLVQADRSIWAVDLESGTWSQVASHGFYPLWSADGSEIVWGISEAESFDLLRRSADLRPDTSVLLDVANNLRPATWSPLGLVFREEIPGKGMDLKLLPREGREAILTIMGEDIDELAPAISPDGRWMAYLSGHTGRDEVYVTSFPEPRGRIQVSVEGATAPVWSPDGRELFYFAGDHLVAARIDLGENPRVVSRTPLFEGTFYHYRWHRQFDVHPDGQRFAVIANAPGSQVVHLVLDWFDELARLAPPRD